MPIATHCHECSRPRHKDVYGCICGAIFDSKHDEIGLLQDQVKLLEAERNAIRVERDLLLYILRDVEHVCTMNEAIRRSRCPLCEEAQPDHKAGCKIQEALARGR